MLKAAAVILVCAAMLSALPARCLDDAPADQSGATSIKQIMQAADQAFWRRDFAEAKKEALQLLDCSMPPSISRARVYVNLATCDDQMDNWESARSEALEGIKLAKENSLTQAD